MLTGFICQPVSGWRDPMADLPSQPGSYAVLLHLAQTAQLEIGSLGSCTFPPGDYVYLGSAGGPGGLRARLGRHLGGVAHLRWHVDYLRQAAIPQAFGYQIQPGGLPAGLRLECCWSKALLRLPGARLPMPGFGASDCRHGCPAHLVGFHQLDLALLASLGRS